MVKQHGVSLMGLVITLAILAFVGVSAAKMLPSYSEYFSVKKIFKTMEDAGETRGTVNEIRRAYDRRNAIEDVKSVQGSDLEITKEGGETIVTASWSVKIPMVYNISACVDFYATTAK
jgi:type II secretory pathway component PulJ